jgi:uncharacterized phiE125 gp8 family phage protein
MSLILITPPTAAPISVAELKAQCRVDSTDQDALLAGYIKAATDFVEEHTGQKLLTQTWAWSVNDFPWRCGGYIALPLAPVQSIVDITYLDPAGAPQVLSPGVYAFRGDRITLAPGATWPSVFYGLDVITITFVAGFGPDHNYVPEALRQAVMMMASYWFSQREAASIGPDQGPVSHVPFGVREILEPFKLWAI